MRRKVVSRESNPRDRFASLLSQHYQRTKDERKAYVNLLLGFCGGAILLSVAFMEQLAPSRLARPVILVAWLLFGLAMLLGVLLQVRLLSVSIRYQQEQHRKLSEGHQELEQAPWPVSASLYQMLGADGAMTLLAVMGAIALAIFAAINLWR